MEEFFIIAAAITGFLILLTCLVFVARQGGKEREPIELNDTWILKPRSDPFQGRHKIKIKAIQHPYLQYIYLPERGNNSRYSMTFGNLRREYTKQKTKNNA